MNFSAFVFPSTTLLRLVLASLTAHAALAGSRVTTSLYALSLHASAFTVGTLIALFSLFPMIFAVPAGRLVDRIGVVRPLLAGAFAIAAGCALPGMLAGLPVVYLATLFIGTGFMLVQVVSQHAAGAMGAPHQRAANFGWLALGYSVSGFCGPVIAGQVIERFGFAKSFMVCSIFALSSLLLALRGRLQSITFPRHDPQPGAGGAAGLLRDSEMRRIYLVGTLLSSAWDLFTFVVPIHGSRLGFPASTVGLILGCFSLATFSVRLAMPWISRRYSEWQVLSAALTLSALCYALFPLTGRPLTLMAVAASLGLAVGSSQPNMLALLHHCAPPGRTAEAVGIRITIGNACQVILPLAFGGAGATLGLSAVFWGMGLMIASGLPLAWSKALKQ